SVVPLIMGFGCNVPAVLSTRTIDDTKTRLTTILIIPFISCSARLPIYVLFVSLFFPNIKSEMIMLLYLIGFGFAIFSAFILRKTLLKGEVSFIMEMPPYRIPTLRDVIMLTWNRTKHFLQKAGTVILAMSIVIWFITNFPSGDITESYAAKVGILIQPIFQPMGWGWEETLAILMGFVAKEVVVETFGIVLGDTSRLIEIMTPSQAFGFIIFTLLYMPCMATLAVIKAETESWKWVIFSVLYTSLVAYFTALLAVNVLSLVGW
ncbi:MAG: ferrous iron transport protein B, partial [Thaumarchaeota archaeon]